MDLEIIERGTPHPERPSLLFVHGFWQAAWTWDRHVMPDLAGLGHHSVAVSLRGHGSSKGRIRGSTIGDYVEDVRSIVGSLEAPPILIGHSMGGFTCQHYLAGGHPAAGVVLVSPVPRKGAWGATWKAASKHPLVFGKVNLTLDVGHLVASEELAYGLLVAESFTRERIAGYMDELESASYRVYLSMLLRRPDLGAADLPALVVGGTQDAFFSESQWRDTARALDAELVMLNGIGHQPMWEEDGRRLTAEIDRFAKSLYA